MTRTNKVPNTINISIPAPASVPWLSQAVIDQLADREFKPLPGERKALRKPRRIRPSKWAERYRVLPPKVSALPGRWRNSVTPYLAGIMDAAALAFIRDTNICKAPQAGVTEAVHNFIGSSIDQDPGPVLYVFPDEDMGRENMKDRIEPMVSATPHLRKYLTGSAHDSASVRLDLRHVNIYVAWARSASKLGNKPIRYVSMDEVDKYPDTAGRKESSPIALAEARTIWFSKNCKRFKYSTPTIELGNIWQALLDAEMVFVYEARCPVCGARQVMVFDQIKWEGGKSAYPNTVEAWYECNSCQAAWDDVLRNQAVARGVWRELIVPENKTMADAIRNPKYVGRQLFYALKKDRPENIGFHLPAWLSRFVPLSDCAAAFIRGQRSKVALRNFMNNIKAEPWVEYDVERESDQILALKDVRPAGLVPGDGQVAALLGEIDTQDDGFWYEIRAFGFGFAAESWQIRAGFIAADWTRVNRKNLAGRQWRYHPAFDQLRKVLWEDVYRDPDGKSYPVYFSGIDAMGHHTSEVYDFCRAHRGKIAPIQGMNTRSNTPYKWKRMDYYPGTNRPIPGGIKLLQLDVHHYKDELSGKLQVAPLDPGAWHMNRDTIDAWAEQMCVEYLDEKTNRWECPSGKANHSWDCSVYGLALADVVGIKHWPEPDDELAEDPPDKPKKKQKKENPYTCGGSINYR